VPDIDSGNATNRARTARVFGSPMLSITGWFALSIVAALGIVAYAYAGYPVLISFAARLFGKRPVRPVIADAELPTVTLVIGAYNEALLIKSRLENALQMDYPRGKFDIVVASDGSQDGTNEIVRELARSHGNIRLLAFAERRGKAAMLNDVIPHVRGTVVMLSDANTYTEAQAARQLAAWFVDPAIGTVCGKLLLIDPAQGRNVDGLYWKYETFLKVRESRLGALLGSNGGIYAIRKSAYVPIPDNTFVDDFVVPLLSKMKTGLRIVYDSDAKAIEETPASMTSEFHRRARIGAGGFQAIGILRGLLNPLHGWVTLTFINHKLLRWVSPFLLLYAILANAFLVMFLSIPGYGEKPLAPYLSGLLAMQVAFYVSSLFTAVIPNRPKFLKIFRLPAMFTLMNVALGVGFYRWMMGRQKAAWKRTARGSELILDPDMQDTLQIAISQGTVKSALPGDFDLSASVAHS
jgi:cellulose synthase/poly-beta-1,6-N-acetylglucosamine synthase-like glycosyltransferase